MPRAWPPGDAEQVYAPAQIESLHLHRGRGVAGGQAAQRGHSERVLRRSQELEAKVDWYERRIHELEALVEAYESGEMGHKVKAALPKLKGRDLFA